MNNRTVKLIGRHTRDCGTFDVRQSGNGGGGLKHAQRMSRRRWNLTPKNKRHALRKHMKAELAAHQLGLGS